MDKPDTEKLDLLEREIIKAGLFAKENQKKVHRSFKEDGSVLTETDTEISHRIITSISSLFPSSQVISEEENTEMKTDPEFYFVLDPIDGTDVYSQGLPSFAVSLGILDSSYNPVGAMIFAPRFGLAEESLFVRLDPGGTVRLNGKEIKKEDIGDKDEICQICVGSKGPKKYSFTSYKGKTRIFGSTILHLLLPSVTATFQGALIEPCFVWDIASSHAVMKYFGMDIEYYDGDEFNYTPDFVNEKKPFSKTAVAGSKNGRNILRAQIALL